MKILAVDDDAIFLELLNEVLKAGGYDDVLVAQSAEDALKIIMASSEHIDTFLLDIRMPGKDGIALCGDIRKLPLYADTPILMLTAVKDMDSIDRAFAAGATDYVTKPLKGLELGTRIKLAHMLNTQVQLAARRTQDLISVKNELDKKHGIHFEDVFEVEGTIEYLMLENYLLKLAPGSYAMQIFGLKIMDVEAIFEEISISDFSLLLNRVSGKIARRYASSKFMLTYAGRGIFGCVLMGRDGHDKRSLEKLCGGTKWSIDVLVKDEVEERIHLIKGASPPPHFWSGANAAAALAKAIGRADERCRDEILQERLNIRKLDSGSLNPRRIWPEIGTRKVTERLGQLCGFVSM